MFFGDVFKGHPLRQAPTSLLLGVSKQELDSEVSRHFPQGTALLNHVDLGLGRIKVAVKLSKILLSRLLPGPIGSHLLDPQKAFGVYRMKSGVVGDVSAPAMRVHWNRRFPQLT